MGFCSTSHAASDKIKKLIEKVYSHLHTDQEIAIIIAERVLEEIVSDVHLKKKILPQPENLTLS